MASLNSIQIQALVRDMDYSMRKHKGLRVTNPTSFREKVVAENQLLYNQFPTIFEMHIEGKLDGTFFEMLKLRRQVESGELTDDQASRIIGNKLFNKYVAPVVGQTAEEATASAPAVTSYADYYKENAGSS
uniref:Uncharacterized protein n=1 Tax=viral metagenome TaxID=1070528 RepID=A0A6C0CI49_9ZZZZ